MTLSRLSENIRNNAHRDTAVLPDEVEVRLGEELAAHLAAPAATRPDARTGQPRRRSVQGDSDDGEGPAGAVRHRRGPEARRQSHSGSAEAAMSAPPNVPPPRAIESDEQWPFLAAAAVLTTFDASRLRPIDGGYLDIAGSARCRSVRRAGDGRPGTRQAGRLSDGVRRELSTALGERGALSRRWTAIPRIARTTRRSAP